MQTILDLAVASVVVLAVIAAVWAIECERKDY